MFGVKKLLLISFIFGGFALEEFGLFYQDTNIYMNMNVEEWGSYVN